MFYLTGIEQLSKAIERARAYRPKVKTMEYGLYAVTGQTGSSYVVACYRDEQNRKVVECNCQTKDGVACKHAAVAIAQHIHNTEARRAAVTA